MANEFRLIPGTLPEPYCFESFQKLYSDTFLLGQIVAVNGSVFYNLGDTEPTPELRDYPWFRTLDGYWYFWSTAVGAWVRPHAVPASGSERRIWVGDLTALQTYDGGNAMASGAASGPMWEQDTDFNGRIPMGVGTLPTSGDAIALGVNDGADEITLDATNLPPHSHGVKSAPDGTPGSGFNYNDIEESSSDEPEEILQTTETGGDAGATAPTDILNPVRGVYFIKRTGRLYYLPV